MKTFEIKAKSYEEALQKGVELTGKTLDELNFVCKKEPRFLFKGIYEVTIIEEENAKNTKKQNEKQNGPKNISQNKMTPKNNQEKPKQPKQENKNNNEKQVKPEKPKLPEKKEEKKEIKMAEENDVKISEQVETVKIVADETEENLTTTEEVNPAEIDHFVRQYIVDFAKVQGVNVEVESIIRDGNKYYTLNGENAHKLIGYHGENLNAMQYIIASVVNEKYHTQMRILLDIEQYKSKREESLKILARRTARRVIQTKRSQKLQPMNANERRIIHSELQSNQKVTTESHGTEPYRYVVIRLK